jgi:hypothetical protein
MKNTSLFMSLLKKLKILTALNKPVIDIFRISQFCYLTIFLQGIFRGLFSDKKSMGIAPSIGTPPLPGGEGEH